MNPIAYEWREASSLRVAESHDRLAKISPQPKIESIYGFTRSSTCCKVLHLIRNTRILKLIVLRIVVVYWYVYIGNVT